MNQVTDELLDEGVEQFVDAIDRLLAGIDERRAAVAHGHADRRSRRGSRTMLVDSVAGGSSARSASNVAQRVWRRDPSLWGGPGVARDRGSARVADRVRDDARARAGADRVRAAVPRRRVHRRGAARDGRVIARAPRCCGGRSARSRTGLELTVLDSTHPDAGPGGPGLDRHRADAVHRLLEVGRHDRDAVALPVLPSARAARSQFVAITDPGSPLEQLAADDGLRRAFLNPPDIGGRYSVLSLFGLVPAALMGVNIDALLHRCQVAEQNCAHYDSTRTNSGLWLGAALGELARQGRDKLTFLVSPPIAELRAMGRAAGRRVDRQAGPGDPAGGRRATRRPGRVRLGPRVRVPAQRRSARGAARRRRSSSWPPLATRRSRSLPTAPSTSAASSSSRSSPSRSPGGRWRSTRSISRTCRRPRTRPTPCSRRARSPNSSPPPTTQLRGLLADANPPHYVAILAYLPSPTSSTRRSASCG